MKIFKKLAFSGYNVILVINGEFKHTDLDKPFFRIYNIIEEIIYVYAEYSPVCSERIKTDKTDDFFGYVRNFERNNLTDEIRDITLFEYLEICDEINRRKYRSLCRKLDKIRSDESIKRKAEGKHIKEMRCGKA